MLAFASYVWPRLRLPVKYLNFTFSGFCGFSISLKSVLRAKKLYRSKIGTRKRRGLDVGGRKALRFSGLLWTPRASPSYPDLTPPVLTP